MNCLRTVIGRIRIPEFCSHFYDYLSLTYLDSTVQQESTESYIKSISTGMFSPITGTPNRRSASNPRSPIDALLRFTR